MSKNSADFPIILSEFLASKGHMCVKMERREKIIYGEDKVQRRGVQSQHKPARTPVAKSGAISYYSVDFRK